MRTTTTGTANANVYGSGGSAYGKASYQGQSTTTTAGQTIFVPEQRTLEKYDHAASFWRKLKPFVFGGYLEPLPVEVRRRLGRNTGVVVGIVVEDSPAFVANILQGDIITDFDGEPVVSVADFQTKMERAAGKRVLVKVIRDNQTLEIPVELNPIAPSPTATKMAASNGS